MCVCWGFVLGRLVQHPVSRGGGGSGRESLLKEVEEIVRSPTYKELSDDNAVTDGGYPYYPVSFIS